MTTGVPPDHTHQNSEYQNQILYDQSKCGITDFHYFKYFSSSKSDKSDYEEIILYVVIKCWYATLTNYQQNLNFNFHHGDPQDGLLQT